MLYLDPTHDLDELEIEFKYQNKNILVKYYFNGENDYLVINGEKSNLSRCDEYYRKGGYLIDNALLKDSNIIELHYK